MDITKIALTIVLTIISFISMLSLVDRYSKCDDRLYIEPLILLFCFIFGYMIWN